jgi:hypothetical protein
MSDFEGDEFIRQLEELEQKRAATPPPELTNDVVVNLAGMTPLQYAQKLGPEARKHRVPTRLLERLVDSERRARVKAAPKAADAAALAETAADLIRDSDLLDRFGKTIERAGLQGETTNAKLLYLAVTSRLFMRPVSIAVKGVSSGGKSFTVDSVLKFFPKAAYFSRTSWSEKAALFSPEDFRHRFIVLFEAAGTDDETMQAYIMRTLLSEGRLSYEITVKNDEGKFESQVVEKEGPTGLITTTTQAKLHPENETRLLSLAVTDTPDQTKAVMEILAGEAEAALDYAPWQALQEWLATGERRVVIPYARWLAKEIPPVAVRLRRDFGALLSLIRAHALLHRENRGRDAQGRIVAAGIDYEAVYSLVEKLFAEGIEATVPATVRQTVKAVEGYLRADDNGAAPPAITLTQLAKELKLDKNSVHHRLQKAYKGGYLVNEEERRGKPARIILGDPLPAEGALLPNPADLAKHLYVSETPPYPPEIAPTLQQSPENPDGSRDLTVGVLAPTRGPTAPATSATISCLTTVGVATPTVKPLTSQENLPTVGVLEPNPEDRPPFDGIPAALLRCSYCNKPGARRWEMDGRMINLHFGCREVWEEERERTTNARAF